MCFFLVIYFSLICQGAGTVPNAKSGMLQDIVVWMCCSGDLRPLLSSWHSAISWQNIRLVGNISEILFFHVNNAVSQGTQCNKKDAVTRDKSFCTNCTEMSVIFSHTVQEKRGKIHEGWRKMRHKFDTSIVSSEMISFWMICGM